MAQCTFTFNLYCYYQNSFLVFATFLDSPPYYLQELGFMFYILMLSREYNWDSNSFRFDILEKSKVSNYIIRDFQAWYYTINCSWSEQEFQQKGICFLYYNSIQANNNNNYSNILNHKSQLFADNISNLLQFPLLRAEVGS